MGNSTYCSVSRSATANASGFFTKSVDEIFTQQKQRKAHADMMPNSFARRECRDSDNHPNTFPIILGLDVTGSMGRIPENLIRDGLPTLMSSIIERGVPDAALCFVAVGDHAADDYPLQVAQFESGDKELDMWLTRTYLEGGGGGNNGESYFLPWYVAAKKVSTDNWEKRQQKGILITIGDEPCLPFWPKNSVKELVNPEEARDYSAEELLKMAQEQWYVYHIHMCDGAYGNRPVQGWKDFMGENVLTLDSYQKLPQFVAELVVKIAKNNTPHTIVTKEGEPVQPESPQVHLPPEILL
jgi:hypothetical protein